MLRLVMLGARGLHSARAAPLALQAFPRARRSGCLAGRRARRRLPAPGVGTTHWRLGVIVCVLLLVYAQRWWLTRPARSCSVR